jgi:hypothetical protein
MTPTTTENNPCTQAESRFPTQQSNDTSMRFCKRPGCLKWFSPVKRWQVFCCPECHDLYWAEVRLAGKLALANGTATLHEEAAPPLRTAKRRSDEGRVRMLDHEQHEGMDKDGL